MDRTARVVLDRRRSRVWCGCLCCAGIAVAIPLACSVLVLTSPPGQLFDAELGVPRTATPFRPAYSADIAIYLGHPTIGLRYHNLGVASCIIIGVCLGLSVGLCGSALMLCFLADRAERRARARASPSRDARSKRWRLRHLAMVVIALSFLTFRPWRQQQTHERKRPLDLGALTPTASLNASHPPNTSKAAGGALRSSIAEPLATAVKWWSGASDAVTPLVPGAPHWRVKGLLDALEALLAEDRQALALNLSSHVLSRNLTAFLDTANETVLGFFSEAFRSLDVDGSGSIERAEGRPIVDEMTSAHRAYAGNALANFQRMHREVPANFELPKVVSDDDDDDAAPRYAPDKRLLDSVLLFDADGDNALRLHEFIAFGTHAILYAGVLRAMHDASPLQRPSPTKLNRANNRKARGPKVPKCENATGFEASTTCVNRAQAEHLAEIARCPAGPIIVLGTAGSGTRVASDILEIAGVFLGKMRNCERDHREFIKKIKPLFFKPSLPNQSIALVHGLEGTPDYDGARLPSTVTAGLHKSMPQFYSMILGDYNRHFNVKKSVSVAQLPGGLLQMQLGQLLASDDRAALELLYDQLTRMGIGAADDDGIADDDDDDDDDRRRRLSSVARLSSAPRLAARPVRPAVEPRFAQATARANNASNLPRGRHASFDFHHEHCFGFKEPHAMWFLPALLTHFPDARVVHVVRDGRDIAWSSQQRMPVQAALVAGVASFDKTVPYEDALTAAAVASANAKKPAAEIARAVEAAVDEQSYAVAVARTWALTNLAVAKWARREMSPDQYISVRLEDLCGCGGGEGKREHAVHRLLRGVLNVTSDEELANRTGTAASCVDLKSCRCEKFRQKDERVVRAVEEAARGALDAWGYGGVDG